MSSIQLRRLGLGLGLALFATAASAETVSCTPITSVPYTIRAQGVYCLTTDLATTMTSGNAITIDANNVVLDLNGHKIGGLGAGPGTNAVGILAEPHQNITIKNGTIRGFFTGISFEDRFNDGGPPVSQGHIVEDVRVDQSVGTGIGVYGRGGIVRRNQVVMAGGPKASEACGIILVGPGARAIDNEVITATGQGAGLGIGIVFFISSDSMAVGNRISGTDKGIVYLSESTGKYRDNLTSGVTTPYTGGTDAGNNQ